MKKLSILFLSLVVLVTSFTSCTKNENPTPATTALELVIKGDSNAVVQGASAKLYATDADRKAGANQIGTTQISDASGKVKFDNLQAQLYYFTVTKADGCLSNSYTIPVTYDAATSQQAPIVANKTTSLDIPLLHMGTITFTNTVTTDSYNVYVKATTGTVDYQKIGAFGAVSGINSATLSVPVSSWDVKFIKLDSSNNEIAGSDIMKTQNVVTACGTTTVTVP